MSERREARPSFPRAGAPPLEPALRPTGLPPDRRCRSWSLDNALRRRIFPPGRTLDALELRTGQTVVDLGAGVGYFARAIQERIGTGGRLILVDPDAHNLELARRKLVGRGSAEFRVGTADLSLELPDGSADRVLLYLVLCCLRDKEGALAKVWSLLRPGGLALVSYPVRRSRTRPSLRMTEELWASLVGKRPWTEQRSWGRFLRHHLLQKPPSQDASAAGRGASSNRTEAQTSFPPRT